MTDCTGYVPKGNLVQMPCDPDAAKYFNDLKVDLVWLKNKLDDLTDKTFWDNWLIKDVIANQLCCADAQSKIVDLIKKTDEINSNITLVKGWYVVQNQKLNSLLRKVTRDSVYNSFQEWVLNVYLQGKPNIYHNGDIYINVNKSIWAINATYINIRLPDDTSPLSAEDWQILLYTSPADILTILGIDPIEIAHPDKDTWIIKLNPMKLKRILEWYPELNFNNTNITINNVYWSPKFYFDVHFQKNIKVENSITSNDITVNNNATINNTTINKAEINNITNSPEFDQNIFVRENVYIGNGVVAEKLEVKETAKFNEVEFGWPIYIQHMCPKNAYEKKMDIRQWVFLPSFGRFILKWNLNYNWSPWSDTDRTRLIWLGTPTGINIKWQQIKWSVWKWEGNKWNTPDVYVNDYWFIAIKNSGVYNISYIYNIYHSGNVYANRGGYVIVKGTWYDYEIMDLIDTKINWAIIDINSWSGTTRTRTDHIYSTGDYTSLSEVKTWWANAGTVLSCWPASGSSLIEVPCGEVFFILPYIKPSCAGWYQPDDNGNTASLRLTPWEWNTGAAAQISIHKVGHATTTTMI